ncbi:hypothetical protein HK104_005889, partial [Borealophlyctis nickersoniae]
MSHHAPSRYQGDDARDSSPLDQLGPASNHHHATPYDDDEVMDDEEVNDSGTEDYESLFGSDDDDEEGDDDTEAIESDDDEEEVDGDRQGGTGEQPPQPSSRGDSAEGGAKELLGQQADMRKRILTIQKDTSISPAEKAKKIQELMSNNWNTKQKAQTSRAALASNKLENKRIDFDLVTDHDKVKTFHDKDAGILGCKHYQRSAKLQAHCCGKWYTCRFCHDEVSDHNIVRNLTTTMMCMYCHAVQPAGQECINTACGRRVAKYYCKECKLWDDDPRKNIYHCYDCGICRIGKGLGQDYFHCKKCNVCMAISLMGRHKCIERNLESDCPICGEYMFTSTTTVIFMPCGHCIHYKCHQEYIQTSYQCPTCFKSLADMTEYFRRIDAMLSQHHMPPEYANTQSFVYCNDCEKKSYAKFHFLYHKCGHCEGYNTKVLHTLERRPEEVTKMRGGEGVATQQVAMGTAGP